MEEKNSVSLLILFLYIIPKNLLSRMTGFLAGLRLPLFLRRPLFDWFIRAYGVNVEEAEREPLSYASLNLFFTRTLKPGARPLSPGSGPVSPVDGRIAQFGPVRNDRMIQAKGIDYSAAALLAAPDYADRFIGGDFITIYLSPPDYHRIHSPVTGHIIASSYRPGQLFPVNEAAVRGVRNLFPRNERITSFIEGEGRLTAVVKVGATNVGRIRTTYDDLISNRWIRHGGVKVYDPPPQIERGAELARFEMGSTVILLFEKGSVTFSDTLKIGDVIRMGVAIGSF